MTFAAKDSSCRDAKRAKSDAVITGTGYAWAALMATLGVTNLVIAVSFDFATWAWFVSFGAVGAKLVAFTLQYIVFRTLVRRRLLAAAA